MKCNIRFPGLQMPAKLSDMENLCLYLRVVRYNLIISRNHDIVNATITDDSLK